MQNTQLAGKKRAAPGAAPTASLMQTTAGATNNMATFPDPSNMTNDQFLSWGGADSPAPNDGYQPASTSSYGPDWLMSQNNQPAAVSNQLVRRNQNNQLTTSAQPYDDMDEGQWLSQDGPANGAWYGDNGALTEKADKAKKEALTKRPPKQIPPFIQKLSSFLDNNSNEDLIRWSSIGDSFIVVDEEQFANKLIPELFKHNNYASFVRQLNMYGFHKKVGLTDNSMRASERKAKSPSEYENAYFKKGRPELLWLIAKPRSGKKKKGQEDGSDDDEGQDDPQDPVGSHPKKLDLVTLPRSQLANFQSEIQQLQRQQQHINTMIARFQHENSQYIRQASERHERHENSINAILQFLATFYSRNADNSGNLPNMFGGNLPDNQPSGNVQEMNDYEETDDHNPSQQARPQPRRPLALLPAPDAPETVRSVTPEAAVSRPLSSQQTMPKPSAQAHLNPTTKRAAQVNTLQRNSVEFVEDSPKMTSESTPEAPTPKVLEPPLKQERPSADTGRIQQPQQSQSPQKPPLQSSNSEIMRLIHDSNAASPNMNLDFNSALKNYENSSASGPLTPEQRNNVLSMMANTAGTTSPVSNALLANASAQPDLLQQYASNQEQLDLLHRLQQEQDSRVQTLTNKLQPLSPHGSIPGLEGFGDNGPGMDNFNLNSTDGNSAPDDGFDINNWLNTDDGTSNNAALDLNNNFNFDDAGDNYFGDVTAGSNVQVESGTETVPSGGMFDMSGQNVDDLFADEGDAAGGNERQADLLSPAVADRKGSLGEGSDSGKVIGSVASSSAGRSPALEAVEDEEEGGRRKRQRTS